MAAYVNTVMNLRSSYEKRDLLNTLEGICYSRMTMLHMSPVD